jgi:nucleotide-binding universal stress UspA family protein
MDIYTLREKKSKGYYENIIKESDLAAPVSQFLRNWHYYEKSEFDAMLYDVPHDALMVLGAYGHGVIKDLLFGSKMEKIQSTVTNNLLITGPRCELSLLH